MLTGSLRKAIVLASVGLLTIGKVSMDVVSGQDSPRDWSDPILIFDEPGYKNSTGTALAASGDGRVHVFWQSDPSQVGGSGQPAPGADTLWYSQIIEGRETAPVNILVPPPGGSQQRSVLATFDRHRQLIHLFRYSYSDCVLHSIARLEFALLPQEWSRNMMCVGEAVEEFGIAKDADERIHLVYPIDAGQVRYARYSPSIGEWSEPVAVVIAEEGVFPVDSRIAVGSDGTIHVAWSAYEAPDFYPPIGVFYARSADGGQSWTVPQQLADEGHVEPQIVAIGDQQIHVVWNGAASLQDRYHRVSYDGGRTWSALHVFEVDGGILGGPAVAVDSAGHLHTVLAGDNGLFYAYWSQQQGWSLLQQIWEDASTAAPSGLVTSGNQLHLVFVENSRRVWYMNRIVDAPLIVDLIQEPLLRETETAWSTAIPPLVLTPQLPAELTQVASHDSSKSMGSMSAFPVLVASSLVVLLILITLGINLRGSRL